MLCYFDIEGSLRQEVDELYRPEVLPLSLFHFHYPAIAFPVLLQHFRVYFPPTATPGNLRLIYQGHQLPVDLPLGLLVTNYS